MAQILLLESDTSLAATISATLQTAGHRVMTQAVATVPVAAVVIGFVPPEKIIFPPQITVIALGEDHGLRVSEILPRPLRLGLLLERLEYHLRLQQAAPPVQNFGGYRLDVAERKLHCPHGALLELTDKETAILQNIAAAPQAVLTREQLLASVWNYHTKIDTHTLETHIYHLRRKLADAGERADLLLSEAGGYRLNV
jgi:hypothetical protein